MKKLLKILLTFFAVCLFTFAFVVPLNPAGNWYQQFTPNLFGRTLTDVFFLDSLTGWAVSNKTNQSPDTMYVLKTTNGGDNWSIHYRNIQTGGGFPGYFKIYFLNQNTGFACSVEGLDKTTNGGSNWFPLITTDSYQDMSILNTDTIWIVSGNPLTGGVYFTSNGGANWINQLFLGSQNPAKVYFYDRNLGFASRTTGQILYRTSNGGANWTTLSTAGAFLDMYFSDNTTGWKCGAPGGPGFRKTTDGGLNWIDHPLPSGGNITYSQLERLCGLNKDTIYGVGPRYNTGLGTRGMIVRTTNAGINWTFQVPDSNINIPQYFHIKFVNPRHGWAYNPATGVHTTLGGDPIWITPIKLISSEVPKEYELFQNYPNPFNPITNIKYSVKSETSTVRIIVYDVQGREIITLVNQKHSAGTYQTDFSGSGLASGVYFYSLIAGGLRFTRKMLLIK